MRERERERERISGACVLNHLGGREIEVNKERGSELEREKEKE